MLRRLMLKLLQNLIESPRQRSGREFQKKALAVSSCESESLEEMEVVLKYSAHACLHSLTTGHQSRTIMLWLIVTRDYSASPNNLEIRGHNQTCSQTHQYQLSFHFPSFSIGASPGKSSLRGDQSYNAGSQATERHRKAAAASVTLQGYRTSQAFHIHGLNQQKHEYRIPHDNFTSHGTHQTMSFPPIRFAPFQVTSAPSSGDNTQHPFYQPQTPATSAESTANSTTSTSNPTSPQNGNQNGK
ncbi:hypothetical protein EK21DRAFT_94001 [Setomelanomma holmii]|uniref:Uncharacterized protein n=1 Tax=Setomelanomma holmii TaxID=210430 RepID=A0A9P4LHF8_9PLEO|nr:hypothetical protein EK21DRAFT_94001 [Setomelanomma holmii]